MFLSQALRASWSILYSNIRDVEASLSLLQVLLQGFYVCDIWGYRGLKRHRPAILTAYYSPPRLHSTRAPTLRKPSSKVNSPNDGFRDLGV